MGHRIRLSNGRRLVDDVIRFAEKMPLGAFVTELGLPELARLRKQVRPRISWTVLFMKAYALIANRHPELRSCYLRYPWPHLYVHDQNVCLLTVAREYRGETRLLFARFNQPENYSLIQLQQQYDYVREAPVDSIRQFQHQIRFAAFPHLFRQWVWRLMFHWFPSKRLNNFGTFGMSISGFGKSVGTKTLSPCTTTLGVDPISRAGQSKLLFTFDHRVLDGKPAIDLIDLLGRELRGRIVAEMQQILRQTAGKQSQESPDPSGQNPETQSQAA